LKVFHGIDNYSFSGRPVITVGIFDGVHQGHKKILSRLTRRAAQYNTDSLVMTFDPHPREVLMKNTSPLLFLNTI
jgi:riboflavin kinase/FMN adenylyltransferase